MPTFTAHQLTETVTSIFSAAGTPPAKASTVAELLIDANLTGHDSHGVIRVPQYLDSMAKGEIDPDAAVEVVREGSATALLDGHWDFGQVTMTRAVEVVLEKARAHGLGAVAVRGANHIGRLGSYVDSIARRDMIGLLYVNAVGIPAYRMAPWGGTESRLATDPLAKGIPTSSGEPIVIDMTTTVVAEGKVRLKRNRGETTPDGWLLDAAGAPTNDPRVLYEEPRGSIQPLGGITAGHKGYALNVAIELLAGALTGNGCIGRAGSQLGNGVLLLAVSITEFATLEEFHAEADRFIAFVKSSPPAAGFDAVLMPGEIEADTRRRRRREGIFVEPETWQQIVARGGELGVDLAT
jgi:uncharacterized oxidoreductase